jgi:hypothetical protein
LLRQHRAKTSELSGVVETYFVRYGEGVMRTDAMVARTVNRAALLKIVRSQIQSLSEG